MEFEENRFQDEIELMNSVKEAEKSQIEVNQTLGFNSDALYNKIDIKN